MNKDWTGNSNSIYKTLGASNHTDKDRQNEDYYATEPKAAKLLLGLETFSPNIWECACGEGHLSKIFTDAGYNVKSTDLMDRGFGENGIDFLSIDNLQWNGDVITNPPYKLALDFVLKAKKQGRKKIAMFLKTVWLESESRYEMFQDTEFPLKTVYQFSKRVTLYKGGVKMKNSGMIAYAWYVWDKDYVGKPTIEWIR